MLSIVIKTKKLIYEAGLILMSIFDNIKIIAKKSPFSDNKEKEGSIGVKPVNTSALNVARYILYTAYAWGDCITNLKIQKLLYYAQAWYLVNYGRPLFNNEIRAWRYGPVVPEVYDEYKTFANKPIEDKKANGKKLDLCNEQKEYLEDFCKFFLKYSATELVAMTHSEDPWINAYKKGAGSIISLEDMRNYYSSID